MILLRQSTERLVRVGPFVDATDGVTPETGVTLGAADQAELLKSTGATVDISGATFAAISGVDGWYNLTLTTSHTDTLGPFTVVIQDSSVCLPVFLEGMVITANAWDSLCSTDKLEVDVAQWLGTAAATPTVAGVPEVDITHLNGTTGTLLKFLDSASTIIRGTVDNSAHTPSATEFEADDITEATADHFNGRLVVFVTGVLAGQAARINDYALVGANGRFTVSTMTEAPGNNDQFVIV